VTDREATRLVAWSTELRHMHALLREALRATRQALTDEEPIETASPDLLLYCHGFCTALDGHHQGEDRRLFPAIEAAHPPLAPVLRALQQDHSMIAHLLHGLRAATEAAATPEELGRHLDGVAALMENHFRYEEAQLLTVLEHLELDATTEAVLGPL
jgi:hemerythrin-like domain-containing protein